MKKIITFLTAAALISCNSDSTNNVESLSQPKNFSASKYNEDLIGKFYLPEMNNVITKLSEISVEAKNNSFQVDDKLKDSWRSLTSSYQRVWPLNHATLDRDTTVSGEEISLQFIGVSYAYSSCDIQSNIVEKSNFRVALIDNPGINTLEFLIFANVTGENFCNDGASNFQNIEDWLNNTRIEDKKSDLAAAVHLTSKILFEKLNKINNTNKVLYNNGESDLILSSKSTQKAYDSMVIFIDKILKDKKVAEPLGFDRNSCAFTLACPTAVEHQLSGFSFYAIANNMEGIMAVFNQNPGMIKQPLSKGLFQYLAVNKKQGVAQKFFDNILEAHKIATSLQGQNYMDLAEAVNNEQGKADCENTTVENNLMPVCALYKSIKSLSDFAKIDLRLALALSETKEVESDGD